MSKYHVNPSTGNAGVCNAVFKCPFGDLEADHYATKEEANKAYEAQMSAQAVPEGRRPGKQKPVRPIGQPIKLAPTALRLPTTEANYEVDYDYDYYGSRGEDNYDEFRGLRIKGWADDNPDGLASYARYALGLKTKDEFPEALRNRLLPVADRSPESLFEVNAEHDYYGETAKVTAQPELANILKDYYYDQPNAIDRYGALPYIRGKGMDTTGLKPLEAIKTHLRSENNGKIVDKVENAKSFKVSKLNLSNIRATNKRHEAKAAKDPREPLPVKETGQPTAIAGVVYQTPAGEYELVDGYHRLAHYRTTSAKKASYIVLSNEVDDGSLSSYMRRRSGSELWESE